LLPEALNDFSIGTGVIGVFASYGGLPTPEGVIPIGGTLGIQFAFDDSGNLGVQAFIGLGLHAIPHGEITFYAINYIDAPDIYALNGLSVQGSLAGSYKNNSFGLSGEYIFRGGYQGYGISYSPANFNLGSLIGININLVLELQYTWTLYS